MKLNNDQRIITNTIACIILGTCLTVFTGLSSFQVTNFTEYFLGVEFELNVAFVFLYWIPAYFFSRPPRRELLLVLAFGALIALTLWLISPPQSGLQYSPWLYASVPLKAFGISCFFASVIGFLKAQNYTDKKHNLDLLIWYAFTATMAALAQVLLRTTITLNPITYDIIAYRIDNGFGFQASIIVAKLSESIPYLKTFLNFAYTWLPLGLPVLYGIQLSSKKRSPVNILHVWAISLGWALLSYNIVPIAGPIYQFRDNFPQSMPILSNVAEIPSLVLPFFRNGFPSMHLGWALMLWFGACIQGVRWLIWATAFLVVSTILATLGKGEHYLIDLVVAVPFIVAVQSFCMSVDASGQTMKHRAMMLGAGLWLFWVCAVRYGLVIFETIPGLVWVLSIFTIAISAFAYRRVLAHAIWIDVDTITEPVLSKPSLSESSINRIVIMFFISGFTGLMYEVIFSKELALTFGGMSTATYTVLTVYMGGMAIGAWLGGKLVTRKRKALVLYAICELVIGLYCLATPFLFDLIRTVYVSLSADISPDSSTLLVLRIFCGAVVLLIPTVLMGMTLPIMVAEFERRGEAIGNAVSRLYGANTLGAAAGALIAGYFILPIMGIWKTTALCAVGSLIVALLALKLSKITTSIVNISKQDTRLNERHSKFDIDNNRRIVRGALLALFIVGVVTMIMEVEYMLLLAVVAGNSTYGFSLMLFSLLLGLGVGAILAKYLLRTKVTPSLLLACLLISLSCILLLGIFQWDKISDGFAIYQKYPHPIGFGAREWIRGLTCWLMMFPPAVIIGACYPIALETISSAGHAEEKSSNVGSAVALNTVGNIFGTLLGGFIFLPLLGALTSIQVAAGLCFVAAAVVLWSVHNLKGLMAIGGAISTIALFVAQPATFNYTALASGSNVYFASQTIGKVIDHAESLDGGLTSVTINKTKEAGEYKTLLTNGKFQGNNVMRGEMKAQLGFAVAPLLHTVNRSNALVIGYGTGVSARALKESGFESIDIVDLSKDLVNMANKHFSNVNDNVSEKPGVKTFFTDGRNYLLLRKKSYNLISMEITSIWFAGAAALYNQEFYKLAANRMTPEAILQQWVQLHHISPLDIGYILGSVRAEFPFIWLYVIGDQGIIIASKSPRTLDVGDAVAQIKQRDGLMNLFQEVGTSPIEITTSLVLDPQGVDRLISSFGISPEILTSTDDNLFLEYSTPHGNMLDGQTSFNSNIAFLKKFSTTTP